MPFNELAKEAKKLSENRIESGKAENLIEANEMPKRYAPKKEISYKDSEIKGFVPGQRTFGSRTSENPQHGSIIRNISSQSSTNSQTPGNASWNECKHRKENTGKDYCAEYHSLCAKEKCRRAKR